MRSRGDGTLRSQHPSFAPKPQARRVERILDGMPSKRASAPARAKNLPPTRAAVNCAKREALANARIRTEPVLEPTQIGRWGASTMTNARRGHAGARPGPARTRIRGLWPRLWHRAEQ